MPVKIRGGAGHDDGLKISDQFAKSTKIGQASKYPQVNKGIF